MNNQSDLQKKLEVEAVVEQMAAAIDLPIAPEYKLGVVENFTRIAEIARRLDDFPLPSDVEVAPTFWP